METDCLGHKSSLTAGHKSSSCVTFGRLFNLSEPQFPHLKNGGFSTNLHLITKGSNLVPGARRVKNKARNGPLHTEHFFEVPYFALQIQVLHLHTLHFSV